MRVHYLKVLAVILVLLSRVPMVAYLQCRYSAVNRIIIECVSVAAVTMPIVFSNGLMSLNLLCLVVVVAAGSPVSVYYLLLDCVRPEMEVLCWVRHHFGCLLVLESHLEDSDLSPFMSMSSAVAAHYFLSVLSKGQSH